ncbi:MAG: methionyl-tRNA formyltransferase [Candidatus Sumerlaeia bacterium]|nr:methionyl-tRNA formyltransferase [Candidatus Sumerlaeia bacterium]
MRVVFFGSPAFALPTLQMLIDSPHEVAAVVSQPDKPAGRGLRMTPPPVKELALANGLPVLQPEKVRTDAFAEELAALAPDVAVVVAYGKILPKRILETPRHGCLNIHASLLPKYRGAAPIQWAIVRGETKTGVSIMQLDEGMDTGAVVSTAEVDILEDDDARSLADMLSMVGADEMRKALERLAADGRLDATPQDHAQATMAPLIKRDDARIDWARSAEEIICAARGFVVWPQAFTANAGKELKITGVDACAADWVVAGALDDDRIPPGTVVDALKPRGFVVKTGNRGLLLVTKVKPEGGKEMGALDALNGGVVRIGARLG